MEDHASAATLWSIPSDKLIDASKPIVFHVGSLGDRYWKWVNQPEPGKPRFFQSSIIEACSKTPWWVVPLLWIPIFTSVLCYSTRVLSAGTESTIACILAGILAWQCLEYAIHRFAFHANLKSYWGITFHFLFHGCHHKYPKDDQRLVFPPVPASMLVGAVYLILTSLFPLTTALPLFAGMGYGYVLYDCAHYAIHHSRRGLHWVPMLDELKRRHLHHHYRDHGSGYGISSTFIDIALGTSAKL
jgi:dihydroceramide fatty acyl 2-hydroxylase